MTSNLISSIELNQKLNEKTLVLSSRQMNWNGIFVEQYQDPLNSREVEFPATSSHWLALSMGPPAHLTQKGSDRLHESIIQKGDSVLVPAGQLSYWCRRGGICDSLHIRLKPELIEQIAEASEIDPKRIDFVNCFAQQDLQLHQIAMLLFAELQSDGVMGRLYIESLTQVLVIHLLRHYSIVTQPITSENRSLTRTQLQQAIDYIHTHLDRDLSLAELASVINISPTYFASLFKQATGISPYQYVIRQRVERAKVMLSKTDLTIADIALQVGFSSQSHLTQHFKRFTGMTPKQIR
ncbi:helix-turn-helix transcriptional regulator [Leptolyngbya sp. FACHB-671]|uniref:helix-turn-helix domain-containing protein n=1 Tax=Leptolyngbya sp. FACHB-671 TaxID=2692812 RepID=UPI001689F3A0|nr:AraC family transcriptional regulator [Leptolyngbya sp. FACHB-671]MBD2066335.1 helix-turn-helix transcriptional regulator [Leptolyngbya sp. FACHB-671]